MSTSGAWSKPALSATIAARQTRAPGLSRRIPQPTILSHAGDPASEIVTSSINTIYDVSADLAVTFTVPPSGIVDVTLSASYRNLTTGALDWWLRDQANNVMKDDEGRLCSARVGPNAANNSPATVTIRVAQDSTGAALIPGNRLTLKWGHSAGTDNGYTVYGGSYPAARMVVTPVSHRLTERTVSQTVTNTGYRPVWLTKDRSTLIGFNHTNGRLSWSTDDGATWTTHADPNILPGAAWVRDLDNGELVVFCGQGDNGQVWTSDGWSINKATATFTKRLDFTGSPAEVAYGAHPAMWGVDAYGPIVLAAEYGPKNGLTDMGRYVYLSQDYGITWETIFDLAEKRPANGSLDAHIHGVCYDPWWDAIWVIQGDNAQRGHWVSFDKGASWTEFLVGTDLQFTTVCPMPDCILLVSDVAADGIYRIPRVSKTHLTVEAALSVAGAGINIVGTGWYQNRHMADAPLLLSANAAGLGTDTGHAWATYDGYEFVEFFTDTVLYSDMGAQMFVGPTLANKYHGFVVQGGAITDWKHAVVTLA